MQPCQLRVLIFQTFKNCARADLVGGGRVLRLGPTRAAKRGSGRFQKIPTTAYASILCNHKNYKVCEGSERNNTHNPMCRYNPTPTKYIEESILMSDHQLLEQ
jgi:hypothetical protein